MSITADLLIFWYIFCACLIGAILWGMRLITHNKFRDSTGDSTTEVGYEEDPAGKDLTDDVQDRQDQAADPHSVSTNLGAGPGEHF